VAAAARRDDVAVRESLAADLSVQDALMRFGLPGKLGKKDDMLKTNVKKLEHVLYVLPPCAVRVCRLSVCWKPVSVIEVACRYACTTHGDFYHDLCHALTQVRAQLDQGLTPCIASLTHEPLSRTNTGTSSA
jgi:hypothetical protein